MVDFIVCERLAHAERKSGKAPQTYASRENGGQASRKNGGQTSLQNGACTTIMRARVSKCLKTGTPESIRMFMANSSCSLQGGITHVQGELRSINHFISRTMT